eukprot:GILJ01011856.1.p1 GENE.GILJ01011856.1~~GILJ01011856.1.p1  ORF type:complete len:174 (+),score=10.89 GILJ01011856.1:41-562(+)
MSTTSLLIVAGSVVAISIGVLSLKRIGRKSIDVFLGGACGTSTWRRDIAIPILEKHEMTYYNPQVEEWRPELMELEAAAQRDAQVLLFVIDDSSRGIASIVEAAYFIGLGRHVILVLDILHRHSSFEGELVGTKETEDINRGRKYLRKIASTSRNCVVFQRILDALHHICQKR